MQGINYTYSSWRWVSSSKEFSSMVVISFWVRFNTSNLVRPLKARLAIALTLLFARPKYFNLTRPANILPVSSIVHDTSLFFSSLCLNRNKKMFLKFYNYYYIIKYKYMLS